MTINNMTNEEKANLDKLVYFYDSKIKVHIKLLRTDKNGKNIFMNGMIVSRLSDRLFLINERVLGYVRLSISEIKPNGVMECNL